ncbi:MAG TPA: serine/threonine protein kinase, partial [Ktedonobacteraceae bacterium]|nr:serine/threonine protein kinase [Ktedonobacteraceae bacterium]
ANQPFDTTISVGPATGGTQKTIYHQAPSICVRELRAVAPQTLLMTVQSVNISTNAYHNQLWKMKPDGSGRTVLFDLPLNATTYHMNVYTQFPWSNVSRDGSMYTLQTSNQNSTLQTLVFGSLKGGNPTQFAYTSRGSVAIVGWTTWR